jgi:hypothetical protein
MITIRPGGRRLWSTLGTLALSALLSVAAHEVPIYLATRKLEYSPWGPTPTASERRAAAHRVLDSWFVGPHDAFLVLLHDGDRSSIPFLKAALAREPAGRDGVVSCTWTHGREALARLERMEGH